MSDDQEVAKNPSGRDRRNASDDPIRAFKSENERHRQIKLGSACHKDFSRAGRRRRKQK